jgi:putative photosynthetic complex assembly protein
MKDQTAKFPMARVATMMAGVAVIATLLTAHSTLTGNKAQLASMGDVQQVRDLRLDTSTGDLRFFDQSSGALVAELPTLTEGFVQVTMRNLSQRRVFSGKPADAPYQLTRYSTGHIVLHDPLTDTTVAVSTFGNSQAKAFARLLKGGA